MPVRRRSESVEAALPAPPQSAKLARRLGATASRRGSDNDHGHDAASHGDVVEVENDNGGAEGSRSGEEVEGEAGFIEPENAFDDTSLDLDELVRVAAAAARAGDSVLPPPSPQHPRAPESKVKYDKTHGWQNGGIQELDSKLPPPQYIDFSMYGGGGRSAGAVLRTANILPVLARGITAASDAAAAGGVTGKAPPLRKVRAPKDATAGRGWFNMRQADMTSELRRDAEAIRMRNFVDPKRFYKANDAPSKFMQLGTVKEGAAEWKSGRLTRRERRQTIVDELIADAGVSSYTKGAFLRIQDQKQRGKKKHCAKVKHKRKPDWQR
ncbi:unnamed protein product [Phaeothamnion confervicola]